MMNMSILTKRIRKEWLRNSIAEIGSEIHPNRFRHSLIRNDFLIEFSTENKFGRQFGSKIRFHY